MDRIVSVTEARSRLSELVEDAADDTFWVLTKGGKPRVALVDVAYLDELLRRARFNELAVQSQSAFDAYLRRQGVDPNAIDETEVDRLLSAD